MPLNSSQLSLPGLTHFYKGKVRDVYTLHDSYLIIVASDRISAFDYILPQPIPYKGQVLNQIAAKFLIACRDICPNWFLISPHPNVSIGRKCEPIRIEMVVRGYLAGHAWRLYREGKREVCGVELPEGLKENDKLPTPIITPATKAEAGHDEDISKQEILARGIVTEKVYADMERHALALFSRGTKLAAEKGLILVDTKYEFGMSGNLVTLIDEIHTPDSSRYFFSEGYHERQESGKPQQQLSKEFVREWLIANNFQGKEGQTMPEMTTEWVQTISNRYIELYEHLMGKNFEPAPQEKLLFDIEQSILDYLHTLEL